MKKIFYTSCFILMMAVSAFGINAQTVVSSTYSGLLDITMLGGSIATDLEAEVRIDNNDDETCTFTLPDFIVLNLPLGDIVVENVSMTADEDGTTYSGVAEGMEFLEGAIVADVTISGTISNDNVVDFAIDVVWNNDGDEIPINVTFTSEGDALISQTVSYDGYLNIDMLGMSMATNLETSVQITSSNDGTCTFTLPDFSVLGMELGDIVVENVSMTADEDGTTYSGVAEGMEFLEGAIVADVTISGTISNDNVVDFAIDVVWNNDGTDIPINVTFTSEPVESSSVANISLTDNDVMVYGTTGYINITGAEGRVYVYNIAGQLVASPVVGLDSQVSVPQGLYVVKVGKKATKVIVK